MSVPRRCVLLAIAATGALLTACVPKSEAEKLRAEIVTARQNFETLQAKSAESIKRLESELAQIKSENETLKAPVAAIDAQRKEATRAKNQSAREELKRALTQTGARIATGLSYNEFRIAWSELQGAIAVATPSLSPNERDALAVVTDAYRMAYNFWERSINLVYSGGAKYRYHVPLNDDEIKVLRAIAPRVAISETNEVSPEVARAAFLGGCRAASEKYVEIVLSNP